MFAGIRSPDSSLGRKLVLRHPIQAVRLARELDIVGDVWAFAHQFIGLDDKIAHVPPNHLN